MKKIIFIAICILSITNSKAQNSITPVRDSVHFNNFHLKIGVGVFIPKGKLNEHFGNSTLLELNFNLLTFKEKSLGIAFQFAFPQHHKPFKFIRNIDTVSTKSNLMFNVFFKLNRNIFETNKNNLNAFFGLGISTIQLDARNPFYSGQEGENKYEFISAILFTPGLDYTYRFKNNYKLTLGINYHYSPYKTEGALQDNIGNSGIIPKILFTF